MKTNIKLMAMAAVALLAMNACSNDDYDVSSSGDASEGGTSVTFEMGIKSLSRTSYSDYNGYNCEFIEGDAVGVYVYDGDGNAAYTNVQYVLGNDGTWTAADGSGITVKVGSSYSFYAYYPYSAAAGTDASNISFSVSSDQTGGYTGSDMLTASNSDVTISEGAKVELTYDHAFALVEVELSDLDADVESVTLKNVCRDATVNLMDGNVSLTGSTGDVIMYDTAEDGGENYYRAIVPAQTIPANTSILIISTSDGDYRFTYDVDVPYVQGAYRKFSVNMNSRTLSVVGGSINGWKESEEVSGNSSVEQVVETVKSFTIKFGEGSEEGVTYFSSIDYEEINGSWSSYTVPTGDELAWYLRCSNDYTVVSVEDVEGYGTVLSLYCETSRPQYNNNAIICHVPGPFERGYYNVKISVFSDAVSSDSSNVGILGTAFSNADDTAFFMLYASLTNMSWNRNVTTWGNLSTTAFEEKSFYVDLTTVGTPGTGSSSNVSGTESTSDDDVEAINIELYNYTSVENLPAHIYIGEISLEYVDE